MGVYLNPKTEIFSKTANSELFIDKTEMILYLNSLIETNQNYVSVSRPRRFGKTLAANMLCQYYNKSTDSRKIFENLKLAHSSDSWDKYLGKFDVIRLVMTDFFTSDISVKDSLKTITKRLIRDLKHEYPDAEYDPDDLSYSMDILFQEKNCRFVIVIDEWDAVFRTRKNDKQGQIEYLNFLRNWLKDKDYVVLAYMTGILPIKKYGEHSALNMFDEYSMIAPMQLAKYTGFTDDEVKGLCSKYKMNYKELSDWYDGYRISDWIPVEYREIYQLGEYKKNIYHIYSPLSVLRAVKNGIIKNYWNNTENYVALADYICMDFNGLKNDIALLMNGGRLKVNIRTYQNDMTTFHDKYDVLTLLIHLGYLGYDEETSEVFIPNKEVLQVFRDSTQTDDWSPVFNNFKKSQELLKATWNHDESTVAEILEYFHDQASNKTYNDESALNYSIQMAYYAARKYYTDILELDTGKGYADIVYIPAPGYSDKPVLLIELKYNQTADTAVKQIKARNYPEKLEHYKGNILLVGINYNKNLNNNSSNFKHHSCIIETA